MHKGPKTMAAASRKAATAIVYKYKPAWELIIGCWPLLPLRGFKPCTCKLISCMFRCFVFFYWKACSCDVKEAHTEAPTLCYNEQQLRVCSQEKNGCVHTERPLWPRSNLLCCGWEGTWRSILIMTQAYELSHASSDPHTPHICDPSLWTRQTFMC